MAEMAVTDEISVGVVGCGRCAFFGHLPALGTLNALFLVSNHVVTEVIESELIICSISNVAEVSLTSLIVCETVEDTADCKSEPAEHLAHFLSLCLSKVVVNCNDVNAQT